MSTTSGPFGPLKGEAPGGLGGPGGQSPGVPLTDGPGLSDAGLADAGLADAGLAGAGLGGAGLGGPPGLPRLPGFREMALRRMAAGRRRLVGELTAARQAAGLSQTQVAARMGTSQSAVARLESGEADVRASTLERYAAAIGSQISWRLDDTPPGEQRPLAGPEPGPAPAGPPARPGPFGSPGLRPAAGPLAPAAQHQPYEPRQEGTHDRTRG